MLPFVRGIRQLDPVYRCLSEAESGVVLQCEISFQPRVVRGLKTMTQSKDEQISILAGTVVTLATGAFSGEMDRGAILAQLGIEGEPDRLTDDHVFAALERLGCRPVTSK